MGQLWARPLFMVWVNDITVVEFARELVPSFDEDGAPFPHVLV